MYALFVRSPSNISCLPVYLISICQINFPGRSARLGEHVFFHKPDRILCVNYLKWLTTVFQRVSSLAMIACQTSVLITHAQMTQVTLRRNENHFST